MQLNVISEMESKASWRVRSLYVSVFGIFLASSINVVYGFTFINKPPEWPPEAVFAGSKVELDCRTTDNTSVPLLQHNGRDINKQRILQNGSIFTINNFKYGDQGSYKCSATNSIGRTIDWMLGLILIQMKLTVSVTPYLSKLTGDSFNVTCNITLIGGSNLTVKWEKKVGSTYVKIAKEQTVLQKRPTSYYATLVLVYKNAPAMSETQYRCVAQISNPRKTVTKDGTTAVIVRDPVAAKITYFTKDKEVILHTSQPYIFHCASKGAVPPAKIRWFKNDKELKGCLQLHCTGQPAYKLFTELHQTGGDATNLCLKIYSPKNPEDEGEYTCETSNNIGSHRRSVWARFNSPPILDKSVSTILDSRSATRTISCTVKSGYPLPKFTWSHQPLACVGNDQTCKPNDKKWLPLPKDHHQYPAGSVPTATSNVTVPAMLFAEFYRCQATNTEGQAQHFIQFLRSKDEKSSVKIKAKEELNAEQTLTARCDIFLGNFSSWYKDGQRMSPSSEPRFTVEHITESNVKQAVTMMIANTTVNDSGTYMCASRELNSSAQITVNAVYAPRIINMENVTAFDYNNNRTNAEMKCDVDANPPPDIYWSRVGSEKNITRQLLHSCPISLSGIYKRGGTLLFCDVLHSEHSAWYTCTAQNYKGVDKRNAYLNVLTPPTIHSESTHQTLDVAVGKVINRTCTATGNPIPMVEWRRSMVNGSVVVLPGVARGDTGTRLVIEKTEKKDFGNYSCVARNSQGVAVMYLTIKEHMVSPVSPPDDGDNLVLFLAGGIGAVMGLLLLVIILVFCVIHFRNKKIIEEYKTVKYLRQGSGYKLDPDRSLLEQCNDMPYDHDWEFPEERLILQDVLGSGAFGQVVKAEAVGILSMLPRDKTSNAFKRRSRMLRRLSASRLYQDSQGNQYARTPVAVKMLKGNVTEDAKESDYKDLASELKIMIHLGEHKDLINLLGACTGGKRLMIIMEYAPHGNLLHFLRGRREIYEHTWVKTVNNPNEEFTLADLVMDAYQIVRGMDFLSSKKCIHRDLAARNILVGEDYAMKIGDFGLARDIYKTDLYVKQTSGILPVKWMAPESLFDREYSTKSDVWSFGIVLWEILTLGGTPYPGLPLDKLLEYLTEGKRMTQPKDCPPEMYAVMTDCWMNHPDERPAFSELVRRLERVLEKKMTGADSDNPYISVFMDDEVPTNYYLEPSDVFSTASDKNSINAMTETEIIESPLPPIPSPFLDNSNDGPEDSAYCEPCDDKRNQLFNNLDKDQDRRPNSESSTGLESGIGLEEHDQENNKDNNTRQGPRQVKTELELLHLALSSSPKIVELSRETLV